MGLKIGTGLAVFLILATIQATRQDSRPGDSDRGRDQGRQGGRDGRDGRDGRGGQGGQGRPASNQRRTDDPPWPYIRNLTAPDPFNATAHRINNTNASYWNAPPFYYNGTNYTGPDGNIYPCVNFTNGSNGTNCSWIYGDLYLRGYYARNTKRCQPTLMQSYGLEGFMIANRTYASGLCPTVKESCCSRQDYFNAFVSWEEGGVHGGVVDRVNFLNNTYNEYLTALSAAYNLIGNIGTRIQVNNNCKVLANAIKEFELNEVLGLLQAAVRQTYGYLSKNFESFYCGICDADNHPFFDLPRQRVVYSHKFTREWLRQTLPFLLYFHVHLAPLNNLIVDFVSSCDAYGNFTKTAVDESLFRLHVDERTKRHLLNCRRDRDSFAWFKSCLRVFRAISLTSITPFMTPNLRKMTSIASFIQGNIQILQNQVFSQLSPEEVCDQKANNARVLAEKVRPKRRSAPRGVTETASKVVTDRRLQQRYPAQPYNRFIHRVFNFNQFERTMIPTALNDRVDFENLRPAFATDGYDSGEYIDNMNWQRSTYEADFRAWSDTLLKADAQLVNQTIHRTETKIQTAMKGKSKRVLKWYHHVLKLFGVGFA